MKLRHILRQLTLLWLLLLLPAITNAQGTLADYERANSLRNKFQGLAVNLPERAVWIEKTSRFWYRKSVKGGNEFVLVDAETLTKRPAFDHEKLAASLSASVLQANGTFATGNAIFASYGQSVVTNNLRVGAVEGSTVPLGQRFGEYNGARDPRIIQLGVKIYW